MYLLCSDKDLVGIRATVCPVVDDVVGTDQDFVSAS